MLKWSRNVFAGASPSHATACKPSRANPVVVSPGETAERPLNARLVYGSTSLAENEKKHSQERRRPRLEATELDLELARY